MPPCVMVHVVHVCAQTSKWIFRFGREPTNRTAKDAFFKSLCGTHPAIFVYVFNQFISLFKILFQKVC